MPKRGLASTDDEPFSVSIREKSLTAIDADIQRLEAELAEMSDSSGELSDVHDFGDNSEEEEEDGEDVDDTLDLRSPMSRSTLALAQQQDQDDGSSGEDEIEAVLRVCGSVRSMSAAFSRGHAPGATLSELQSNTGAFPYNP